MALTDAAIRSAKPKKALQKISDGEGLQLWVQPNGSKLWRMAYRFAGKQKSLAFGAYPDLSLAEARKKRDEAKALLAAGTDPGQQKRIDKLTRAISNATTFRAVAEEYLDKQKRE
ncbi:MAG: Arm DNA-binding domain-containing protein, partial [Beijerinckiaceae bacterium]|nr:Arm DNA-binding domain-containing protein [Beijerinckiaceae bacterium]